MADVRVTLAFDNGTSAEVALTLEEAEQLAEQLLDEIDYVRSRETQPAPDMFKRRAH